MYGSAHCTIIHIKKEPEIRTPGSDTGKVQSCLDTQLELQLCPWLVLAMGIRTDCSLLTNLSVSRSLLIYQFNTFYFC